MSDNVTGVSPHNSILENLRSIKARKESRERWFKWHPNPVQPKCPHCDMKILGPSGRHIKLEDGSLRLVVLSVEARLQIHIQSNLHASGKMLCTMTTHEQILLSKQWVPLVVTEP